MLDTALLAPLHIVPVGVTLHLIMPGGLSWALLSLPVCSYLGVTPACISGSPAML